MLTYLTKGRDRTVYAINGFPGLLAKVGTADPDRLRKVFAHEERFLRAMRDERMPVTRILGHCDTSYGVAQITECICDDKGGIAANLLDLLTAGSFNETHLAALNDFVDQAISGHIPMSDFSLNNLVYGRRGAETDARVYVVDGFGDKSFIQIKRWFRWANTPHLTRKLGRIPPDLGLAWNRRARRYEMAGD